MSITRSSPVQVAAFSTTFSQAPKLVSTSWSKISVGPSHVLAIKSNNTLWAWGINTNGQIGDGTTISRSSPVQLGNPGYTWNEAIAGINYSVAVRGDGLLFTWGLNSSGVLGDLNAGTTARSSPIQIGTSSWVAVSAGGTHVVAIRSDKSLWSWGLNTTGQLGTNDYFTRSSPVQVSSSSWASVSAGQTHTTAITSNGKLFTWGDNTVGTLGYTTPTQSYYSWTNIAGNVEYTVAIRNDGLLFAWGTNQFGQLGDGTTIPRSSPVQIGTSSWSVVTANALSGGGPTLAIRSDGTLWGWGFNATGVLGIGDTAYRSSPVQVSGGGSWITVSSGKSHTVAIKSDYTLYTWGLGTSGQLGDGLLNRSSPVQVGASSWTKVGAGDLSSYAISLDGKLFAWGSNSNGQQGDPAIATTILRSSPTQIGSNSWTNVFAHGSNFVHAIDSNYKLFAWGVGVNGQLGYNDLISRSSPVQISSGNWSTLAVFSTAPTALAIQTDGSLWAWGLKTTLLLGEFSNASYTYSWSQVSAGPSHTAAIRSDGRLYTWGLNSSGQIGNNTVTNTSSPTLITTTPGGAGEYWNRVSVNGLRTVGISSNGTLWAWGSNAGYLLGDGTSINRSAPVQIGIKTGSAFLMNSPNFLSTTTISAYGFGTGDFTIECWFYLTNPGATSYIIDVASRSITISCEVSSQIFVFVGGTTNIFGTHRGPNIWQHIALSKKSNLTRLFVNGIQSGNTYTDINDYGSTGQIIIGKMSLIASEFAGYLAGIRVLKGVGSYNSNFIVSRNVPANITGTTLLITSSISDDSSTTTVTNNGSVTVTTQLTPFLLDISYTQVSSGLSHTLVVSTLGRLYAWGDNTTQQLGIGSTLTNVSSFTQVGTSSWSQVSSYGTHNLGIDINNKLYGWGVNTLGQVGVSSSPLQWTVVDTYTTTQMLRNDGILYAMGQNNAGQIGDGTTVNRNSPVQIAGSWSTVSASIFQALGLGYDGILYAWGKNTAGQLGDGTTVNRSSPVQIGTSSWSVISAGNSASAAIDTVGRLFVWGLNTAGQIGDGTTVNKSSPVQIAGSWSQISLGTNTAMAIRTDGTLYTWGVNSDGLLGLNDSNNRSSPVQVGVGNSYIKISGKNLTKYAIRSDYTLWGWGNNQFGQIGDNSVAPKSSPTQINTGFTYDSISSGSLHAIAKRRDGTIWAWGSNSQGSLGLGNIIDRSSPTQVGSSSWVSVSAGNTTTFGITVSAINGLQNIYGWGLNNNGQLGLLDTISRSSPVQIGSGQQLQFISSPTQIGTSSWTSISAGLSNSFAIRSDYKLFSWGDNSQLQSGYITPATILGTGSNPNNNAQSYIRNTDNALIVWGINSSGEIGDGTTINRSSPVQLGLGLGYSQFAKIARAKVANLVYTLGVKTDGTLWSWGNNVGGKLGIGLTTSRSSPVQVGTLSDWSDVAAGPSHALAIKSDGSLWGWGINTNGQIGDNTTINRSSPVQIGTSSWTAVSAGTNFSTAIRTDGGLFTWGFGTQGQLGSGLTIARSNPVQVGTESYTSISSGGSHAVALRTDLTLYAWGLNNAGQLGDTSNINRSSPVQVNTGLITSWNFISAGANHTVAIDATNNLPFGWGLNTSGQIGDSTLVSRSAPVQVSLPLANNNYSYSFNGSTQYLSLVDNTKMSQWYTTDYTIEMWSYNIQNRASGTRAIPLQITYGQPLALGAEWGFGTNASGNLLFYYNNAGTNITSAVSTSTVPLNTWTHIAMVYTNANTTITGYINGVQAFSVSRLGTPATPSGSPTINIGIAENTMYYGYISNLRIVKGTALYTTGFYPSTSALTTTSQGATAGQVSLLTAQSATIVDNSTNTFTITNTGTVAASITNPFGPYYSGSFNGTSQYLRLDGQSAFAFGSGDFTIELWIMPTAYPAAGINAAQIYDTRPTGTGSTVNYQLINMSATGILNYSSGTFVTFGGTAPLNVWTHLAVTRQGTDTKLYVNGTQVGTTITGDSTTYIVGASRPVLGTDGNVLNSAGYNFTGYMSNIRVVKGVAVYTGNFTVPTNILRTTQSAMTNITALTGTETSLLTLQSATIVDNSTNVFTITNNGSVSATTAYAPFSATSIAGNSSVWDSIIAGVTSTMGTSNNTLFTWGAGTTGQLGDSTTVTKSAPTATGVGSIWSVAEKLFSSPVQVGTAKSWSLISTGGSHAVATATDNTVWSWGQNNIGQLGDNTTIGKSSPTQIAGNTSSYTFVTAGVSNTFAVRSTTALLFAWGQNNVGQIGNASTVAGRSSPVQVFAGTMTSPLIPIKLSTVSGSSYTQVQAGSAASIIDSEGRLFTWGTNTNGQVGNNTVVSRSSPVQVGGIQFTYINSPTQVGASSWSQVSAGSSHTLAIDSNSLLYAWGKTPANGDTVTRSSPMQIGANSWINVSTGNDLSLATDTTKTLYAWGLNTNYQLGSPNFYLNQSVTSPVAIGTLAVVQSETTSGGAGNGGFIKNI